jgi:ADP-ribose pyrophosphatase YjhB (NUDIX family)
MPITLAVRALIVYEEKILLVKHKGSSFYSLPGGKLEENEDLKTALVREMKEEFAVDVEVGEMAYVNEFKFKGIKTSLEFFFFVKNPEVFLKSQDNFDVNELDAVEWIDVNEEVDVMPKFLQAELPLLGTGLKPVRTEKGVQYFSAI